MEPPNAHSLLLDAVVIFTGIVAKQAVEPAELVMIENWMVLAIKVLAEERRRMN